MDSNITNEQDFEGELLLAEPHFDEEATLLSARPVVPLHEIKAEQRLGRRLAFGTAIISALILGVVGAKLIYRTGEGQRSAAIVSGGGSASVDEPVQAPSIVEGGAGAATGALLNAAESNAKSIPWTPVNAEPVMNEARRRNSTLQPNDRELRQGKRLNTRLRDQALEREGRKEARTRQRKSADGLLKIREIFEGPSTP